MTFKMFVFIFLGLCASLGQAQNHPHSCSEVYESNIYQKSGVYTIYNLQKQPYEVYCEFNKGYGYTYISPNTTVHVNIDDIYTDNTFVVVRDLRTNGIQRFAHISQIQKYKHIPLSFQYNAHIGYTRPLNDKLKPYVYIGFLPVAGIHHAGDKQGYRVNGHDIMFTNCDGAPNSYFAFEFNHAHAQLSTYNPQNSGMIHQWVNRSTEVPTSENIPARFFTSFEVHFGGCGGYGSNRQFPDIKGAAVGFRYDIFCPMPQNIANGSMVASGHKYGDTVTYTCDIGFTKMNGDATRTCTSTGQWDGFQPLCGQFPCDAKPCQNNGMCFQVTGNTYQCECVDGFQGVHCETESG